jgi:hypothetical protein
MSYDEKPRILKALYYGQWPELETNTSPVLHRSKYCGRTGGPYGTCEGIEAIAIEAIGRGGVTCILGGESAAWAQ